MQYNGSLFTYKPFFMKRIYPFILTIFTLSACSNDTQQASDAAKAEFDKKQTKLEKNIADQAEQDRPQFEIPAIDYTSPVAKVDLNNDEEIVASVGLPVVEKEKGSNQNGEPMKTYYFSDDLRNGLELSLSREFIDVAWKYDASNTQKAYAVFDDGQRISRALLGGQDGADLYEKIAKGSKFESISLDDGTVIQNARCGASVCRYQVVR